MPHDFHIPGSGLGVSGLDGQLGSSGSPGSLDEGSQAGLKDSTTSECIGVDGVRGRAGAGIGRKALLGTHLARVNGKKVLGPGQLTGCFCRSSRVTHCLSFTALMG